MGDFSSEYNDGLKMISLKDFVCKGKGDDFVVSMDEPVNKDIGVMGIQAYPKKYEKAVQISVIGGEIMLIGVENQFLNSLSVFSRKVKYGGKSYLFPTIFNAKLCKPSEDGSYSDSATRGFCLRLGDHVDPEHHCVARIVYAPGRRIEWNHQEVEEVFAGV